MKPKLIHIDEDDFKTLSVKASKAGKLLKPYIEDLLAKDARNELYTKEHFLKTADATNPKIRSIEQCEVPYNKT